MPTILCFVRAVLSNASLCKAYVVCFLTFQQARTGYSKQYRFHGNQHLKKKPRWWDSFDCRHRHASSPNRLIVMYQYRSIHYRLSFSRHENTGSVFRLLPGKEYFECSLILQEQTLKRKGCASHLHLFYVSCGWVKDSITYLKVPNQRCFEVIRRLVYGMRSIGCDYFR